MNVPILIYYTIIQDNTIKCGRPKLYIMYFVNTKHCRVLHIMQIGHNVFKITNSDEFVKIYEILNNLLTKWENKFIVKLIRIQQNTYLTVFTKNLGKILFITLGNNREILWNPSSFIVTFYFIDFNVFWLSSTLLRFEQKFYKVVNLILQD